MSEFKILIKKSVRKDLKKIQIKDRDKIILAIEDLSRNPKPLG